MSNAGTKDQPQDWKAEPGSRRWFWRMRISHVGLWFAPFICLTAAVNAWHGGGVKDPALFARLVHTVPWVLVGVVVAAFSHALWRIEVNMAAGRHPYTDKDAAVFRRAQLIQATAGMAAILGGFIGVPAYMFIAHMNNDRVLYTDAIYGPFVAIAVVGTLTATVRTLYKRGRQAYEELEKGV